MDSTDFSGKLNSIVNDYFQKLEKELNSNSVSYGDRQPGNIIHCYQIQSLGGVFKIPSDEDVFNLPAPTCGLIKDIDVTEKDKNKFLVRRLLGYTACYRIVTYNDPIYTEKSLNPLIFEMLMSLEKAIGFSYKVLHHGKYATFQRPGLESCYFREMDDFAACELRLFSDTFPLIVLKD